MLKITSNPIPGTHKDALKQLSDYKNIQLIIDEQKFIKRVQDRYKLNNFHELTDLYSVLIQSISTFFPKQIDSNAITPDGALTNIDRILGSYQFSKQQLSKLGSKFLDLGTSSFWDTFTELLYLDSATKRVGSKTNRLEFEYPLNPPNSSGPGLDADLAVLDLAGGPIILLDAITPYFGSSVDDLVVIVKHKYQKKFENYCKNQSNPSVGIIVSVFKIEEHFIVGQPNKVKSTDLSNLPGLKYCSVCTFRSPHNTSKLELFNLIDFDLP
jgi:hypothetical protein